MFGNSPFASEPIGGSFTVGSVITAVGLVTELGDNITATVSVLVTSIVVCNELQDNVTGTSSVVVTGVVISNEAPDQITSIVYTDFIPSNIGVGDKISISLMPSANFTITLK